MGQAGRSKLMANDYKYHIDHHASLVPPAELLQARTQHQLGEIDDEALEKAIGNAISSELLSERRLALLALSDGEFGRRNDLAVVYDAVEGFGEPGPETPLAALVGLSHAPEVRPLSGDPVASSRVAAAEGARLAAYTERATMLALPSAGYVAALTAPGNEAAAGSALAEIIGDGVQGLIEDGVAYVLLRNPALGFLLRQEGRASAAALGIDVVKVVTAMLEADVASIAGLQLSEHFCLGLDLTTGGLASGPWDEDAVRDFLSRQPFGRICVDYGAVDRFPLELVPEGLVVSLGIVDVGSPDLEDVDELVALVDEATDVVDVDDLALAPNGGFHVVGHLAGEYQHAKLQRVEMVARYFWGNEL
jgi:5-methyltetrahydropteroyltriglutamate--homocysteine methyltransferase